MPTSVFDDVPGMIGQGFQTAGQGVKDYNENYRAPTETESAFVRHVRNLMSDQNLPNAHVVAGIAGHPDFHAETGGTEVNVPVPSNYGQATAPQGLGAPAPTREQAPANFRQFAEQRAMQGRPAPHPQVGAPESPITMRDFHAAERIAPSLSRQKDPNESLIKALVDANSRETVAGTRASAATGVAGIRNEGLAARDVAKGGRATEDRKTKKYIADLEHSDRVYKVDAQVRIASEHDKILRTKSASGKEADGKYKLALVEQKNLEDAYAKHTNAISSLQHAKAAQEAAGEDPDPTIDAQITETKAQLPRVASQMKIAADTVEITRKRALAANQVGGGQNETVLEDKGTSGPVPAGPGKVRVRGVPEGFTGIKYLPSGEPVKFENGVQQP